jgi:hypothetical protein
MHFMALNQKNPVRNTSYFFNIIFLSISRSNRLSLSFIFHIKLHTCLVASMHATCLVHLIHHNLIILTICSDFSPYFCNKMSMQYLGTDEIHARVLHKHYIFILSYVLYILRKEFLQLISFCTRLISFHNV